VESDQRKFRQFVAEQNFHFPPLIVVAALATLSFLTFVHVILFVTGIAFGLEFLFIDIALVTRSAFNLLMFVPEFELGLVVIERRSHPGIDVMALLAVGSIFTLVFIVLFVTCIAIRLQLFIEGILFVTTVALYRPMAPEQLEVRVAVVIKLGFVPVFGVVAFVAFLAERSGMNVVDPVA
jgi:hypothetical protein